MGGRSTAGSRNNLPRYSNENGVITNNVVRADSRFSAVSSVEGLREFQAEDILRKVMRMEERGETQGEIFLYEFDRNEKAGQSFGNFLTAYSKGLKAAGYKVTSRENRDSHTRGYRDVKGGRVYASTTKARVFRFEKA